MPLAAAWEGGAVLTAEDVLAALDLLDDAAIPFWIDGGWGIDALVGTQTRAHADLDIVVPQADCDRAREALAALGYDHDASVEPGLPARLVLRDGSGREIDVHPIVLDDRGNGWQPLGPGAWGAYPADGLTGEGEIGGRRVRCLTPGLQLRHHLGYPLGDADRHDLRLLAQHFGLAPPPGV
jgi:lincosamide nucleotidyltransferase A/C/D/E